jgi:Family of unknown function (DUF6171)
MATSGDKSRPANQDAAKAILPNVTTAMAGSVPEPQPQSVPTTTRRPVSGRLTVGGEQAKLPAPTPADAQAFPSLTTQAANLVHSVVTFVGSGGGLVDETEHRRRLEICAACDLLRGNRCAACGCFIKVKARGRVFRCPIGRWQ